MALLTYFDFDGGGDFEVGGTYLLCSSQRQEDGGPLLL